MRPIDKGTAPLNSSGDPLNPSKYQQWKGHILTRIGPYCSYCGRFLGGNSAVEHVQPKSRVPNLTLDWDNLLISCNNCNSIKSNKLIDLHDYLWPDHDNTFLAFEYLSGGVIQPAANLSPEIRKIAINTINLTGLDRMPSDSPFINPEMKDSRWRERRTAYDKAQRAHNRLKQCYNDVMKEQIIDTATATGFFSIWMTEFQLDKDMCKRLMDAFPGTSTLCFNQQYKSIHRPGGIL